MYLTLKIRIKPTESQEALLWQSAGTARWAYNWALSRQQENYTAGGKFLSDNDLRKELTQIKKQAEYYWLNEVSAQVPKQAIIEACEAYKRFFKKQAGFPKFKSRKRTKPSFYTRSDRFYPLSDKTLNIEKIGRVKTSEQLPIVPKYSNPRVTFDGKYWYLSVGLETEPLELEMTDEVIGIDLGITTLAVCSDGSSYPNINKSKTVRKEEKKLKRLQRQVSRKYEMNKIVTEGKKPVFVKTKNIIKAEKKLKLQHRRLKNLRDNHLHQTTTAIVKTKPCKVVMEDLNVSGMMKNKHLSKAIQCQKFFEFTRMMIYKCEKYGIEFQRVDRFFPSSKKCSCCGGIKKDLKLKERLYKCNSCGHSMERDLNAAMNLRNEGLAVM